MARWQDVRTFIHQQYKAEDMGENIMKLVFDVGDGRSQLVFLIREALLDGSEEWVVVASPFAPQAAADLAKVVDKVANLVCGGLSRIGEHLVLKHALPLANMDTNELIRPMQLVLTSADKLEQELLGSDAL